MLADICSRTPAFTSRAVAGVAGHGQHHVVDTRAHLADLLGREAPVDPGHSELATGRFAPVVACTPWAVNVRARSIAPLPIQYPTSART